MRVSASRQLATVDDIREGQGIRAMYQLVHGEPVAFLVEVTTGHWRQ